ncbi:MAG: IgGFc-binding protein [Myxococcales bacterium]|nr:IgGFc-binding protein [Myxococcales bacterium]
MILSCGSERDGKSGAGTSDGGSDASDGTLDTAAPDATPGTGAETDTPPDNGDVTSPWATGPCDAGETGCLDQETTAICANGTFQSGTTCSGDDFCLAGACATALDCQAGTVTGCSSLTDEIVCTADGKAAAPRPCPAEQLCAAGACRAVVCTPDAASCTGFTTFHVCKSDGSGFEDEQACETGTCTGGTCLNQCETQIKFTSHIGCEYWSVDLDNDTTHNPALPFQLTPEMFPHSVVITNPNDGPAKVTVSIAATCENGESCEVGASTCGASETICSADGPAPYDLVLMDAEVPAGDSREFEMPVMSLRGTGIWRRAIRIRSSLPVVAYQFNPFDSENAASNDGSLLLPLNALGKRYFAVSLPSRGEIKDLFGNPWFPGNYGFLTVVAAANGTTTVTVTPTADVMANPAAGVPQDGSTPALLLAGTPYTFTLAQFDVLNLEHNPNTKPLGFGERPLDLTGSLIVADKPVAVFGGHQVAGISDDIKVQFTDEWDTCCTEHLEEQLMPVEAWGTAALAAKSRPRGYEIDQWYVVAGEDNVTVSTTPAIEGLDGNVLAKAGDWLRAQTDESFMVSATGKIQVVQWLVSSGQTQPKTGSTPGTGDPSMMIVPPSSQYRKDYVIRTAGGYSENWTTVIRKKGVEVFLDGSPIPDGNFDAFGDATWEIAYQKVDTGTHRFDADEPFGLMVYGYGTVTAYGYPGGMNLAQ